jgi:hypothetical protein
MAKGKYYTPEFKEQAVKMAVGLDCTYDLLHASSAGWTGLFEATGH